MDYIKSIISAMDDAINSYSGAIDASQQRTYKELILLTKELQLKAGIIELSVENLRLMANIKSKLGSLIMNDEFSQATKKYLSSFKQVEQLQQKYFSKLSSSLSSTDFLNELRTNSVSQTANKLVGLGSQIETKIGDLLQSKISTGSNYASMLEQVREYITNTQTDGAMQRYAGQIATDALHQYNGQYMNAVTNDLGLEWFMYTGSNITTTREFCELLTKKRYIHKSEIAEILKGKIWINGELHECKLGKNNLPLGMIEDTDMDNFMQNRGGWQCRHQLVPVANAAVPKSVRENLNR